MGIAASWFAASFRAASSLIGIQTAKCSVVHVFFLLEAHELTEVVHGGCFKLVTGCQKHIAMQLAKGMVEPFLQFITGQIWLESGRQLLDVEKAFLEMAAVVQARC